MTEYIYVPTRTRQSTYMYLFVYDWVHMCTVTHMNEYICVLCRVRPCVYIFAYFDPLPLLPETSGFKDKDLWINGIGPATVLATRICHR